MKALGERVNAQLPECSTLKSVDIFSTFQCAALRQMGIDSFTRCLVQALVFIVGISRNRTEDHERKWKDMGASGLLLKIRKWRP